ncbi:Putative RING finger domain protein [Giardia duodenalis]|uniref:Putative RING finger domain protein n=1 Tax=Giardia intestinalis TaxID=5741 RepID=V6TJV3_GIAIN|nr:Putative RING finger domain protein [Giardia intestinalis]
MKSYVAMEFLVPLASFLVASIIILVFTKDAEGIYERLIAVERFTLTRTMTVLLFESLLFLIVLSIRHILFPRTTNMELLQIYHVVLFSYVTTFFNIVKWASFHNYLNIGALKTLSMAVVLSHMRVVVEFYSYRMNTLLSEIDTNNNFIAEEAQEHHRRKLRILRWELLRPTIVIPVVIYSSLRFFKDHRDGPMPFYYRTSLFVALKLMIQYFKVLAEGGLTIFNNSAQNGRKPEVIYAKTLATLSLDLLEFGIIFVVTLNSVAHAFKADSIADLMKGTAHNKGHLGLQSRYFYIFFVELFSLNESFIHCSKSWKRMQRARLIMNKFNILVQPSCEEIYGLPLDVVSTNPDAHESIEACSICMGSFTLFGDEGKNNPVRKLPCNHLYHKDCIQSWIVSGNTLCPLCGRDVFNPAPQQEPLRSEPGAQNEQQEVPEAPTLAAEPDAIAGQKEVDANATQAPVSIVSKNSVRDISTHPILFEMPVFSLEENVDWNALTLDSIQESINESTRIYLDKLDAYMKMRSHVRELGLFINVVGDIYKPYSSVTTVRADTD